MNLEIIFEDDVLIAINKPHGLLVHRTKLAADAQEFALQMLRDQIGQRVYPLHRLDRKTSGVLLFSKCESQSGSLQQLFAGRLLSKTYLALVRGFTPEKGEIDSPLLIGAKEQEALTHYESMYYYDLPWPHQGFQTSRYTLLKVFPHTGRMHQIRRHLAHIRHPIIGDRPHGCNKQNRLWKERWMLHHMLLHAQSVVFEYQNKQYAIKAPISEVFGKVLDMVAPYVVKIK